MLKNQKSKKSAKELEKLRTQLKAFVFLRQKFQTQEPFTRQELQTASGWIPSTLDNYISKQLRDLIEKISPTQYRVSETFANYSTWAKFRSVVSQVRRLVTEYQETKFNSVVIYEFYLPLKHETTLKRVLDSLFYRDAIETRLRAIPLNDLKRGFHSETGEENERYFERMIEFAGKTFNGYSIYHVDGRFRTGNIRRFEDAVGVQAAGERYLVDETTAVVRFIFPCDPHDASEIGFLFEKLFISSITKLVAGEDVIWMVESGSHSRVHVWEAKHDDADKVI